MSQCLRTLPSKFQGVTSTAVTQLPVVFNRKAIEISVYSPNRIPSLTSFQFNKSDLLKGRTALGNVNHEPLVSADYLRNHVLLMSRPKAIPEDDAWKEPESQPDPKKQKDSHLEGKPSKEQLLQVSNVLQDTLPKLFIQPMNYRIYHDNVVFINNLLNKTTVGLFKYVQQVALLRTVGHIRFAYVKFNVLNMSQDNQEGRITVRWRIVGLSGFRVMLKFWKYKLWKWQEIMKQQETWYDGVSYFDVGSDGKIYRHIADKVMVDKDAEPDVVKTSKIPVAAKLAALAALFPKPNSLNDGLGFQCSCEEPATSTLSDLLLSFL